MIRRSPTCLPVLTMRRLTVVRAHDCDLILSLGFEHRALRDQQRVLRTSVAARIFAYMPGRRILSGLGKDALDRDGAGLDIDLAIRDVKVSRIFVGLAVGQIICERRLAWTFLRSSCDLCGSAK